MGIDSYITDSKHGEKVHVDRCKHKYDANALVVATRDLYEYEPRQSYFISSTNGENMALDFSTSGSELIHNGGDTSAWTASAISGTWDFNYTDTGAHGGSYSIDASGTTDESTAQFTRSSVLTIDSGDVFEGWIYLTSWSFVTGGIDFYCWNTSSGSQVGNIVNIGSYINTGSFGNWQKFSIPATVLGIVGSDIDAIRIRTQSGWFGSLPDYWLDDISRAYGGGSGGPDTFYLYPPPGKWFFVDGLKFYIEDTFTPTQTDGTIPYIPYNTYFGVTPDSGGILQSFEKGLEVDSYVFRKLGDTLNFFNTKITTHLHYDSKTVLICDMVFPVPRILKSDLAGYMSLYLSDDFSAIDTMKLTAIGRTIDWYKYIEKENK